MRSSSELERMFDPVLETTFRLIRKQVERVKVNEDGDPESPLRVSSCTLSSTRADIR